MGRGSRFCVTLAPSAAPCENDLPLYVSETPPSRRVLCVASTSLEARRLGEALDDGDAALTYRDDGKRRSSASRWARSTSSWCASRARRAWPSFARGCAEWRRTCWGARSIWRCARRRPGCLRRWRRGKRCRQEGAHPHVGSRGLPVAHLGCAMAEGWHLVAIPGSRMPGKNRFQKLSSRAVVERDGHLRKPFRDVARRKEGCWKLFRDVAGERKASGSFFETSHGERRLPEALSTARVGEIGLPGALTDSAPCTPTPSRRTRHHPAKRCLRSHTRLRRARPGRKRNVRCRSCSAIRN